MLRPAPLLLALLATATLSACEPSAEDEVRQALTDFGAATAERDYPKLCKKLLDRPLVKRVEEAGVPCEIALSRGLGGVSKPRLEVLSVQIRGDRALASVRTDAANQPGSQDTVKLVRRSAGWRIASLSQPQPAPPAER